MYGQDDSDQYRTGYDVMHVNRMLNFGPYKGPTLGRGSSIGSSFAWHVSGPEIDPHFRHILSWRLGHEIISTAILPLPLIQEE